VISHRFFLEKHGHTPNQLNKLLNGQIVVFSHHLMHSGGGIHNASTHKIVQLCNISAKKAQKTVIGKTAVEKQH
jgi:hypothetical protein